MSKHHKMSATRSMAAAQSLYEASHITYMRTDSVRVSDDATKSLRSWLKDHSYDLPKSINTFKNKSAAQDAHEAIRPTEVCDTPEMMNNLSQDEQQVYQVIWKYFVASQMKPAIFDTLKVGVQLKSKEHTFIASGKALKYKGFLEILGVSDLGSIDIPALIVGDEVMLCGDNPIVVERKQTQPPSRYSEASLIETLEKKEIGRPSTYATLLSTITTRNYVEQNGSIFYPTELGKTITQELVKWFSFLEYDYTAKLELQLDKIAEGQLDYISMLKDFYMAFHQELINAYTSHGSPICDKCGGFMREITAKNGQKFYGCGNYPRCYSTKNIDTMHKTQNP
jgi:DNA topoisomerase-1